MEQPAGFPRTARTTYYAFNIANLHVVVLDPWKLWIQTTIDTDHVPWQRQLEWLREDLKANRQEWTLLVNHFPAYCDGNYNSDDNEPLVKLRELLVPLLDEYGVDLFVAGHDHTYQRSYVIQGHIGLSTTFDPTVHVTTPGDGRLQPVVKCRGPRSGTIYIVSGTAGGTRPNGNFAHPTMIPFPHAGSQRNGLAVPGSLVLEVDGDHLHGWQIDSEGAVLDKFQLRRPE
jgi:hypothetical protein